MISISYFSMLVFISCIWVVVRAVVFLRQKYFRFGREMHLLLVYICIVVVARFTFFPFAKIDGAIQPLIFDTARLFPFRINLLPFVYLFDYSEKREALINLIGNMAMFVPLGIVWPVVYKNLRSHFHVIAAGIGFSLCIEIAQLPFFDRVTDIDDLLLNSIGYILGYSVYILFRKSKKAIKH